MLVTSFCPCLTTYFCLFLVRFAIFDFSDTPYDTISCWDGQRVFMYLEENICRAAQNDYIDGHQTKLLLI